MTEVDIRRLLDLLEKLINEDYRPWKLKREAVLAEASDSDKSNLEELSSWFEPI